MAKENISQSLNVDVSDACHSPSKNEESEALSRSSLDKEAGLPCCRVCQCAESDKRGDAALGFLGISSPLRDSCKNPVETKLEDKQKQSHTEKDENAKTGSGLFEFVSPEGEVFICSADLEMGSCHQQDLLIELGCSCKNDLALVHYSCALKWFVNHGSTICEICGCLAKNVRTADFKKVLVSLKEYEALRERTANGDPNPAQMNSSLHVDPDAIAAIRRQRLSEIFMWFSSLSQTSRNNSIAASQVVSEPPLDTVTEVVVPPQNPAAKWAVEGTGILLATGLLTVTLAWLIAPRVGKKTAKSGLHILLGGICALTVVIFFRFIVLSRISTGVENGGWKRRRSKFSYIHKINEATALSTLSFNTYSVPPPIFSLSRCQAISSVIAEEEKTTFDEKAAASLVKEMREIFKSKRTKSYEWRVSQLKSIIKMIDEKEKDITDALYQDLAKPPLESFLAEISNAKSSCKFALDRLENWMQPEKVETSISTYPSSAEIVSEPLGVVLVISTWNFPFLLSVEPVIGAIAAGNAVVLKPSEIAPATSSLLCKLFEEYLDPSAVRVVEGAVPETTALLDQQWDKILYTGSSRVGRIVMSAAAKHLTPVILELGGKCPAVVDSNIDLQVAMRRIIAGKWQCNSGQACIGVDYIITTKDFAPKLIEGLKIEIENCFGKNPIKSKDISRIVSASHYSRLVKLLNEDQVFDKVVFGGQTDDSNLKIGPTILLDVPQHTQIMQEEIFGPLLPIVTVENVRKSFEVINSKPKPLAAYLFTNDDNLKQEFVDNVYSGGMLINDTVLHVTIDGLPFGGVGESGMGAYHGKYSFDSFSHKKSVLYRSFVGDSTLRYPPYTQQKQKLLKAFMNDGILGLVPALLGWSKD